jgi:hypothetical protein
MGVIADIDPPNTLSIAPIIVLRENMFIAFYGPTYRCDIRTRSPMDSPA